MKLLHQILIFVLLSSAGIGQNNTFKRGDFTISFNSKIYTIEKDNVFIISDSIESPIEVVIPEDGKFYFINKAQFSENGNPEEFDIWNYRCENNHVIQFLPFDSSHVIINDFQFSANCLGSNIKSKINPEEDSLVDGSYIYPGFKKGRGDSKIFNFKTGKLLSNNSSLFYYPFFDLIVGMDYKYGSSRILNEKVSILSIIEGDLTLIERKPYNYVRVAEDFSLNEINNYSNQLTDFIWISDYVFFVKKANLWYECAFTFFYNSAPKLTVIQEPIDSIIEIPFFSPAFVIYKNDSSFLKLNHRNVQGEVFFDSLVVNNYLLKGIEPYIDFNIIVFSMGPNKHLVIKHRRGYPLVGSKFEFSSSNDLTEFWNPNYHQIVIEPINTFYID